MPVSLSRLVQMHPQLLIDPEDLKKYFFYTASLQRGYVYITTSHRRVELLHRLIVNPPESFEVDHINRNRLDNRKVNLRLATKSQNAMNKDRLANNTSGYKGVSWHKKSQKWRATMTKRVDGLDTHIHIGTFETAELAAKAYDKMALIYGGEFSKLNFPVAVNTKVEI
jgi:AP2 domain/HNH endonuclease